ncbi:hypothetical protein GLOTRDRAFT_137700 [Gloeophyllum trabeum ATCC 11539]|uniref:RRM domain-containing protein n=1 Tax=Gloeophyllum trabeum (strain ATCC 11539 / FP-39264 / Madison 617) TaxID=670483 RepID=S7RRT6_GLOTA|nr:uncharacterized protein GLOTRDRAFT_137700 [Gloeophyllum trabeum ATCC 11539]EPQ57355.1 hypothetical protein GLOTRDRAFT_137700 [Gloeophyllum trabeum ATCC 11539]
MSATTSSTDWVARVVDVDCNRSLHEIRVLFSQCGEIRGIHPWRSDKSPQQHFFVEFAHASGVARARALGKLHHHLSVHALAMVPQLVERCRRVLDRGAGAGASRQASPSSRESSVGPVRRRTRRGGGRGRNSVGYLGAREEMSRAGQESVEGWGDSPPPFSSNAFRAAPNVDLAEPEDNAGRAQLDIPSSSLTALLSSLSPQALLASPPPIPVHLDPPSVSASLPSCSNAHIVLTICGERISLDLDSLGDDPQPVIALLQTAQCGREAWMVAGGHYRMRGRPRAALAVVAAMVDVLTAAGVSEREMRPAWVLMAGCHRDLARAGGGEGEGHKGEAVRLLQRVYGRDVPCLDSAVSLGAGAGGVASGTAVVPPSPQREREAGRVRILEREVESLRARLDEAGRKEEGDRKRRREREREVEAVRGELEEARRREGERRVAEAGVLEELEGVLRRARRG